MNAPTGPKLAEAVLKLCACIVSEPNPGGLHLMYLIDFICELSQIQIMAMIEPKCERAVESPHQSPLEICHRAQM